MSAFIYSVDEKLAATDQLHHTGMQAIVFRYLGISDSVLWGWVKYETKLYEIMQNIDLEVDLERHCMCQEGAECFGHRLNASTIRMIIIY